MFKSLKSIGSFVSGSASGTRGFSVNTRNNRSIFQRSRDNTLFFPVIVSNSIKRETALSIGKYFEQKIANDIKMIITNDDIVDLSNVKSKSEFLNQFRGSADMISIAKELDKFIVESPVSLDQKETFHEVIKYNNMELKDKYNLYPMELSNEQQSDMITSDDVQGLQEISGDIGKVDVVTLNQKKDERNLNNLEGTIVTVEVVYASDEGQNISKTTSLMFSVKTLVHYVSSSQLTDSVVEFFKKGTMLTDYARWSSGELRLFKDVLFNFKDLTDVAIGTGSKESQIINTLHHNSKRASKINAMVRDGKGFIPNTTLVLNTSEVELIRSRANVNLFSGGVASKFVKELFLTALVIVDEINDSMTISYESGQPDNVSLSGQRRRNVDDIRMILGSIR